MSDKGQTQVEAAFRAAVAREAIAKRISTLVAKVNDDVGAQTVLHLAQAYAALASEPPRTRGGTT